MEEYVLHMEPRSKSAVMTDVLMELSREEFASRMVLRGNDAALRDVPTML
jgi:hypothetical protein